MGFKLSFKGANKKEAAPARPALKPGAKAAPWAVPKAPPPGRTPGPTTVMEGPKRRLLGFGGMRVGQQYAILGSIFGVLFIAAAVIVFIDNRAATYGTIYVSTSAQMRMLTQRIAKAAQTGLIGSPEAFDFTRGRDCSTPDGGLRISQRGVLDRGPGRRTALAGDGAGQVDHHPR